ncbi:MAG: DUF2156 domain-containing protein [Candidatus Bruticola sp.]
MQFRNINLEDKFLFQKYINDTGCVYDSFAYWYGWAENGNILVAEDEQALYIKTYYYNSSGIYLSPFVKSAHTSIKGPLEKIKKLCAGHRLLVCESARRCIENDCPGAMSFAASRDLAEYIYKTADLINLEGHVYRGKRNRINSFVKKHANLEWVEYTPELLDVCLELDKTWENSKASEGSEDFSAIVAGEAEHLALKRTLAKANYLNVRACLVKDVNKFIGLTVGEQISADTVLIHFEKCHPDYRDLYAWINREFLRRCWEHTTYVNRAEDLGEEGLRRAKLSYNPVSFSQHYWADFVQKTEENAGL